jgi:hypothetical protein
VEWRLSPDVEKDRMQWYVTNFTLFITVVLEVSSVFVLIHYVVFPDSNIHLLFMWMPSWLRTHWITLVLYGVLWVWLVMALYSVLAFTLITIASYGALIVPIVSKELVREKAIGCKTKAFLRLLPKHLTMEYRKIEVIQLNVNEQLGFTLISIEALVGETVVFSNFVMLTMWQELDGLTAAVFMFVALTLTIGWVVFLEAFGMFHDRGKESWRLAKWSSKMDRIWVQKFVKSCKPLAMRSKEHFCVKRLSSLNFLQGIVVGTLSLVLAKSV